MLILVVATRNAHKIREIQKILGDSARCIRMTDLPNPPTLIEDGNTFAANATRKAVQLAHWVASMPAESSGPERGGRYVLADDSGLEVDALDGAPGVFSARFAAQHGGLPVNSSDAENNAKLLARLLDVPWEQRTARFRCVLALTIVPDIEISHSSPVCYSDPAEVQTQFFEGVCEGRIGFRPRGTMGFGYDPLFIPTGLSESFAELGDEIKNRLSHRAQALAKLRESLLRTT